MNNFHLEWHANRNIKTFEVKDKKENILLRSLPNTKTRKTWFGLQYYPLCGDIRRPKPCSGVCRVGLQKFFSCERIAELRCRTEASQLFYNDILPFFLCRWCVLASKNGKMVWGTTTTTTLYCVFQDVWFCRPGCDVDLGRQKAPN